MIVVKSEGVEIECIFDNVFDSMNISFNVNRPVDNKSDMENMKMQYECGALSKQTIIDRSPYVTNTSLELERIEAESMKETAVKDISGNTKDAEELIDNKVD